MKKTILILVLSVLFLHATHAKTADSLVVYMKNSGKIVDKDSAEFYRVIMPPDATIDKDLYRVYDYYPNGNPKLVGTSLSNTGRIVLDGSCIEYFANGKRKSTAHYKNGIPDGDQTNYYPNGKLYSILKINGRNTSYYGAYYTGYFSDSYYYRYNVKIIEVRDSTGNLLAANGTGHVVVFDNDFKRIREEGEVKNNKQDGDWKVYLGDNSKVKNNKQDGDWRAYLDDTGKVVCQFKNGTFKSGTTYLASGKQYTFKQFIVRPVFSDGQDMFYYFIKKNLQYPESEKRKVRGTVLVGFDVETNGTISNVKVITSLVKSFDDEALRVIRLSPMWVPGYIFGIPKVMPQTVSVDFYK